MGALSSLQPRETGGNRYFKFDVQGAQLSGVLRSVALAWNYDQTEQVPELILDTADGEKVVTCSNTVLYNKVLEMDGAGALAPGTNVTITFTGMAGRAKLFDVVAVPGVAAPAAAAPVAPAPVAQPEAPAAAATPPPVAAAAPAPPAGGTPPPVV